MIIPGGNILALAMRMMRPATVTWYAANGRTTDTVGQWVTSYATPVTIKGSMQAVQRDRYEFMGLDVQKNYVLFFTTSPLIDVRRGTSPDKIVYGGRTYICESSSPWQAIDGWTQMLCVDVGAA